MITFKEHLDSINESINDKGIFKAILFAGTPGAGKSYVASTIKGGTVMPRVVNTDQFYEHIAKSRDIDISGYMDQETLDGLVDNATTLTANKLMRYLEGMLPLIIDGTSSNIVSITRRVGLLESLGYDVGMVWVDTDLETSLERASGRDRFVPPEFIKDVHEKAQKNKDRYKQKFDFFVEVKNNNGELTDSVLNDVYKKASGFFDSPVDNIIGQRNIESGEKFLTPNLYSDQDLKSLLSVWYQL